MGILFAVAAVVLVAFGVPVAYVLGLVSAAGFASVDTSLVAVPQQSFVGLYNFMLITIPFFILTGTIMDTGGVSTRLTNFAGVLIGWMRGGLGMVDIVSSLFFADISGSATADTAAIGSVMIPGLLKRGYHPEFATALQSAAGSLGLLFPPSISMIVYAYVANVSVARLFLASFIPGFLVALSFMIVNYLIARKRGYPAEKFPTLRDVWVTFSEAVWAILAPVIILGGILGGVFTPTEAGAVAVTYVLIVSAFIYKELTWSGLVNAMHRSIVTTARVTFLLSMALLLGLLLTRQQLPQYVAANFLSITTNPLLVLALINILLLVLHTSLETVSSILVIVPVLMPLVTDLHIDPVHFGIILLVNSAIGINLPPVGFCLYISSGLTKVPLEKAAIAIMPFIAALLIDLVLVVSLPQLSLFLPSLLGR